MFRRKRPEPRRCITIRMQKKPDHLTQEEWDRLLFEPLDNSSLSLVPLEEPTRQESDKQP